MVASVRGRLLCKPEYAPWTYLHSTRQLHSGPRLGWPSQTLIMRTCLPISTRMQESGILDANLAKSSADSTGMPIVEIKSHEKCIRTPLVAKHWRACAASLGIVLSSSGRDAPKRIRGAVKAQQPCLVDMIHNTGQS